MTDPENISRFPSAKGELIPNPWMQVQALPQPRVGVGATRPVLCRLAAALDPEWQSPLARMARKET